MSALSCTASAMAQSFSFALLYSLWQGFLVFAILFVLMKALPGISARAKYYLSYSSLTAVFIWFVNTWVSQYSKLKGATVYISSGMDGNAAPQLQAPIITTSATPQPDIFHNYLPQVEQYVPLIMLVYCIGLAFMMVRFFVNIMQLRSLQTTGVWMPDNKWRGYVQLWQQHLGIERPVKLLFSDRVDVPMMLGALKPVILLPIATVNNLSTVQVEAIILHELAHIKRHDYLLNLLQTIVETLLFFNPFVWLISTIIRREREHCCDDLVLSCAADPMHYAKALAMLEDNRLNNSLSLAATGNKNQLFHRIKRIMEMKKENVSHGRLSVVLVIVVTLIFLSATVSFTSSFAQKAKDPKKGTQTNTTVKTVTIDDAGKKKVVTKTTTSLGKNKHGDDEDVDINISVSDDDKKHSTANIVVTTSDGKKLNTKNVKKIIVTSDGSSSSTVYDRDKMEMEIEQAKKELESVDWDEIKDEISKALAEVDKELDGLSKEVKIEIRRELENSKKSLAKAEKDMERAKKDSERSKKTMAMASASNGSAKANTKKAVYEIHEGKDGVDEMLTKMEKDGLIDRSTKFEIKKDEDGVFINGKKQPNSVVDSYPYLKDKKVAISGVKDDISVAVYEW